MLEQDKNSAEQNEASSDAKNFSTKARRSFLKKAAISAPILTTIAARPVWAGQCSLSGNLSNNVSNHDHSTSCEYKIYSPGGWLCGSANNAGLWSYTGYTKTSSLASLLGSLLPGVTPADITIEQALSGNGGGNSNASNNGNSPQCQQVSGTYESTGWERQAAAAALNALLWQAGLVLCEGNSNCNILNDLNDNFYFPFTLADIQIIYASGADSIQEDAWEAMQKL